MHDWDDTSSQISLACHWQEKKINSEANLAVEKLPFSIFKTCIKVKPQN